MINLEHERNVRELARVLDTDGKPSTTRILDCIGIFKDPPNSRFGLVFRPKDYLSKIFAGEPQSTTFASRRKPLSLTSVLLKQELELIPDPDPANLSIRFNLAKQIASSIFMFHSAGWVHKE